MVGKKASANWGIIVVIVIVLLGWWLISLAGRECSDNSDCGSNQYCGSDFKCHEKEVVYVEKNSLLVPSIIVGCAVVIAAIIIRWKDIQAMLRK